MLPLFQDTATENKLPSFHLYYSREDPKNRVKNGSIQTPFSIRITVIVVMFWCRRFLKNHNQKCTEGENQLYAQRQKLGNVTYMPLLTYIMLKRMLNALCA